MMWYKVMYSGGVNIRHYASTHCTKYGCSEVVGALPFGEVIEVHEIVPAGDASDSLWARLTPVHVSPSRFAAIRYNGSQLMEKYGVILSDLP